MITSFRNIFRECGVQHIEIPIIQRDYAQGRQDGGVPRIRKAFLNVLHRALTGVEPVGLDFVYGEVENGHMIPLDGQQRLTTLFLLHWYLAARSGINGADCAFLERFTYETRYSARHFCEKLVSQRPPFPLTSSLSTWLVDQNWYAGAWKHDPTIQSMLVALDDINEIFADANVTNCKAAWARLVAEKEPAITFEQLSLKDMGLTDELYIKMNSRGKPLTTFEHFKADFEQTLREVCEEAREEFIRKVDQDWSNLLWPLRNSKEGNNDNIIDDKFLRLFRFLSEIVIHRFGLSVDTSLFDDDIDQWAKSIYGKTNNKDPQAAQRYLFDALDCFYNEFRNMKEASEIADWFAIFFTEKGYVPGAVAIFDKNVSLFGACCAEYGIMQGNKNRAFSLSRTLLLFAVLEYLKSNPRLQPKDISQRLRTLRNLIFASESEIRLPDFPTLLEETFEYVRTGDISKVKTYNSRQITEEKSKVAFLARNSGYSNLPVILHRLEDHDLLRGCLAAFDLSVDANTFSRQAELFHNIFPEDTDPPVGKISGALLACGDYSQRTRNGRYQFGSPEPSKREVWRKLLTETNTSAALLKMLDDFGNAAGASVEEKLQAVADNFLAKQATVKQFDWRYYLVKYSVMRSGASGIYASANDVMSFDLCMLNYSTLGSYYRDPYLLAVIESSGAKEGQDVANNWHYGWDGYHAEKRWIELFRSNDKIMSCRQNGFQLQAPSNAAELAAFRTISQKHGVGADLMLLIPQAVFDGVTYDEKDRIEAAASLLKDLMEGQRATESANDAPHTDAATTAVATKP